ncbi:MAG: acetyl-CoA carboxylase biotin carboxylase subunit [Oscillospiraceae bacterium]|nr:acetyl-CoA carboxylase biotin carboxylase subunit [Oscillospiraceae bacterium]
MIEKILIANRGEIAVRIIRACRELNIRTVAVCSTADRRCLHAQIADETVCIGAPAAKDSYLDMNAVIQAALQTKADAIHPGFGFLSENADFAQKCIDNGIIFIGPRPEAIRALGDKAEAKRTMKNAGVPVIPGSDGAITDVNEAYRLAEEMGYPVMIKASAGGGGKGIRRVDNRDDLEAAITAASQEALVNFGDSSVYMEKLILNPKHIEFQILADKYGNVVHLGERDCSMQRRNQKVLEETPSPIMTPALREKMGHASVAAAISSGYSSAGTIEFLVDKDKKFYFMEMNTRIQVEHPITEEVTGIDLIKAQINIADGKRLEINQGDIRLTGHSIECRINAEKPSDNFRPSPGTVTVLHFPGGPGIRIDSAIYQGYTIPPYYDSMIAKVIVHAQSRPEAIVKMKRALAEFIVDGVDTNIDFDLSLIRDPVFEKGDYDNNYLTRKLEKDQNK